jgi:hypothetical protein
MTTIYDKHAKTFASTSAYVICKDNERIATVAFKFGNAVLAYVHILGSEMQSGLAKGGGYDRQSAAVARAAYFILISKDEVSPETYKNGGALATAMRLDDGYDWKRHVENAGFTVWQAV